MNGVVVTGHGGGTGNASGNGSAGGNPAVSTAPAMLMPMQPQAVVQSSPSPVPSAPLTNGVNTHHNGVHSSTNILPAGTLPPPTTNGIRRNASTSPVVPTQAQTVAAANQFSHVAPGSGRRARPRTHNFIPPPAAQPLANAQISALRSTLPENANANANLNLTNGTSSGNNTNNNNGLDHNMNVDGAIGDLLLLPNAGNAGNAGRNNNNRRKRSRSAAKAEDGTETKSPARKRARRSKTYADDGKNWLADAVKKAQESIGGPPPMIQYSEYFSRAPAIVFWGKGWC